MFSDHLQKIDKMPYKTLLVISAGLVFLCQLVAMVLVVDSQVEKAQIRDAQSSAAQMVIADCSENYSGPARSRCIEQMQARLAAEPVANGQSATVMSSQQGGASPVGRVRGVLQAAFQTRQ